MTKVTDISCSDTLTSSPVQRGLPLESLHGDVLLNQAVEEDGEGGEADVVQRQIGGVIQRLQRDNKMIRTIQIVILESFHHEHVGKYINI